VSSDRAERSLDGSRFGRGLARSAYLVPDPAPHPEDRRAGRRESRRAGRFSSVKKDIG
jgi:hypothetical protein